MSNERHFKYMIAGCYRTVEAEMVRGSNRVLIRRAPIGTGTGRKREPGVAGRHGSIAATVQPRD